MLTLLVLPCQEALYKAHLSAKVAECLKGVDIAIVGMGLDVADRAEMLGGRDVDGVGPDEAVAVTSSVTDAKASSTTAAVPGHRRTVATMVMDSLFSSFQKSAAAGGEHAGMQLSLSLAAAASLHDSMQVLGSPRPASSATSAKRVLATFRESLSTVEDACTIMYMITVFVQGTGRATIARVAQARSHPAVMSC